MNSAPLVSICIPAYNAEKYIAETLNCLLEQTYSNIEIIVVDDHSSDNSFEIVKQYADSTPNIFLYKSTKKGAAAARNQAYTISRGKFVVFFDADDLVKQDFFESQLQKLNFSEVDCVISAWGRFSETAENFSIDDTQVESDLNFHEWITEYWNKGSNMTIPGRIIMSRHLVDKTSMWNEELSLNDDFQFYSNLFSKTNLIRFNQDAVLMYRSNVCGLSSKIHTYIHQHSNLKALLSSIDLALSLYDDLDIKQACSNLLQKYIYDIYPKHTALISIASKKIHQIGITPTIQFHAGGFTKSLTWLLGWKNTKRFKYWLFKYPK